MARRGPGNLPNPRMMQLMKMKTLLPLALAAALGLGAHAQTLAAESVAMAASAPGKAVLTETTRLTATVVAIDATTRTATLKGPGGRIVDVAVAPEAKNFDKVKVGDQVVVDYLQALSLELKKAGGMRAMTTQSASAPAAGGAVAGGAVAKQVVILADVVAVDAKKSVVTLRGPKGNTVELKVPDPGQLKLIKKGDQIEAVYTEAVAVNVEPAPKPAKK